MSSTFQGLEIARSALFAQQTALYTVSNNIANANTEGYTRQRVNFEEINPYPAAGRNRPEITGQQGTGVTAGTIERVRNDYLDKQYRAQAGGASYWDTKASALSRLEGIMNEPSDDGLSAVIDDFWSSLQDLASTPEESGARSVVLQRAEAVADTFNYISDSLNTVRSDLQSEIDVQVQSANSILNQINSLNQQIAEVEPHGMVTNDLYDQRDVLIDQLAQFTNVTVSYDKLGGKTPEAAQGIATITLVDEEGNEMATLVNGEDYTVNEFTVNPGTDANGAEGVASITVGDQTFAAADFDSQGTLKGLMESYGYLDNDGELTGTYPNMLSDLDKLAYEFATAINEVQREGYTKAGEISGIDFFEYGDEMYGAAGSIKLSENIEGQPNLIAAGTDETSGNGDNAQALSEAIRTARDGLDGDSVSGFYEGMIGTLGVNAQEANRQASNTSSLLSQADTQRQSVSGVSLDEEMTNLIRFQHAYNAAARSMTSVDEMLDRIINQMGLVGR